MRAVRLGLEHDAEATAFLDTFGQMADGSAGQAGEGASVLAYHYPFYRDLLCRSLGEGVEAATFAIRDESGAIVAMLPGMLRHSDGESCYNSLPFFGPNAGVLAATGDRATYDRLQAALVERAIGFAREHRALTATFYSPFVPRESTEPAATSIEELCRDLNFGGDEIVSVPKETLYLPLDDLSAWPAKIRYDLRRAEAAGISLCQDFSAERIERVIELHAQTCRECGAPPKPASIIRGLLSGNPKADHRVGAFGAMLDGRLIAALIVLWGPQTASYYLPCADGAERTLQPITWLIDRAIAAARQRDIRYWNFESSPVREGGVWKFKKKWGAIPASYRTTVVRLRPLSHLRSLGAEKLARRFPYFYVYPHALLA
jgi:hypothetical protein